MGDPSANRWLTEGVGKSSTYDDNWAHLASRGENVHGEADLVASFGPSSVLDAGCGTGRVAIELADRGCDVVGVDIDPSMLSQARAKRPDLTWVLGDLALVDLGRHVDAVVMAGNVMIFVTPGTEGAVLCNLARHLEPGGVLVAGFALEPGRLDLATYDQHALDAGLELVGRWATWDRQPFVGGAYAVSAHSKPVAK